MTSDRKETSVPGDTLIHRVGARLRAGDLPGPAAQLSMAPGYRSRTARTDISGRKCADAAVLVLLLGEVDATSLVLTVRPSALKHHGGQVSLPGGRREPGESIVETALRECREEIGVTVPPSRLLGGLTPLYIPPTNFCVYPYVAASAEKEVFVADPNEVARVLTVPIEDLLATRLRRTKKRTFNEREYDVPYFDLGGEVVWGATAMILAEFAALLERC